MFRHFPGWVLPCLSLCFSIFSIWMSVQKEFCLANWPGSSVFQAVLPSETPVTMFNRTEETVLWIWIFGWIFGSLNRCCIAPWKGMDLEYIREFLKGKRNGSPFQKTLIESLGVGCCDWGLGDCAPIAAHATKAKSTAGAESWSNKQTWNYYHISILSVWSISSFVIHDEGQTLTTASRGLLNVDGCVRAAAGQSSDEIMS